MRRVDLAGVVNMYVRICTVNASRRIQQNLRCNPECYLQRRNRSELSCKLCVVVVVVAVLVVRFVFQKETEMGSTISPESANNTLTTHGGIIIKADFS